MVSHQTILAVLAPTYGQGNKSLALQISDFHVFQKSLELKESDETLKNTGQFWTLLDPFLLVLWLFHIFPNILGGFPNFLWFFPCFPMVPNCPFLLGSLEFWAPSASCSRHSRRSCCASCRKSCSSWPPENISPTPGMRNFVDALNYYDSLTDRSKQ